jgi:hypothetical protein
MYEREYGPNIYLRATFHPNLEEASYPHNEASFAIKIDKKRRRGVESP